ncbi:hypothetical protein ACS0TY_013561 [Phlomoides rotata]
MLRRSSVNLQKLAFSRNPSVRFSEAISPSLTRNISNLVDRSSSNCNFKQPHHVYGRTSATLFRNFPDFRRFSVEIDKEVDIINLKFAEAREEIESAMESKETVYFNEEAECARAAVNEVLERYEGLLKKLPENDKAAIQRAMGLKIGQLKAELQQLNE